MRRSFKRKFRKDRVEAKRTRFDLTISDSGHKMDALGHAGDEGRRRPRKSTVSCLTSVDPYVSEWGNPAGVMSCDLQMSKVVCGSIRGELKHLSNRRNINQVRDSLSSGERNGNSLNRWIYPSVLRDSNVRPSFVIEWPGKASHRR